MDVLHVIGTRPNIPKFAPVWNSLGILGVSQQWVATGQHSSKDMFYDILSDFNLPNADNELKIRNQAGPTFVAELVAKIARLIENIRPSSVCVYGDVNSSLGASIAASICGTPIIHIEAGLRSFDISLPEERNRMMIDSITSLFITTMPSATTNLIKEGKSPQFISECGNPMIDSLVNQLKIHSPVDMSLRLPNEYGLLTLHRNFNVDDYHHLNEILDLLELLGKEIPLYFPVHPRTRRLISKNYENIRFLPALSYSFFISLLRKAHFVITDSGGIQEETSFLGIPCFTLRPNTERPETLTFGSNKLISTSQIPEILNMDFETQCATIPGWDGKAGSRIAKAIVSFLNG